MQLNDEYISGEVLTSETFFILNDLPDNVMYSFVVYVNDNEGNEIICCSKVVGARDRNPPVWLDGTNIELSVVE